MAFRVDLEVEMPFATKNIYELIAAHAAALVLFHTAIDAEDREDATDADVAARDETSAIESEAMDDIFACQTKSASELRVKAGYLLMRASVGEEFSYDRVSMLCQSLMAYSSNHGQRAA
jgi:hypothetical protein